MSQSQNEMAPKAPKDPTKKRAAIYLMLNDAVEGRLRENQVYSEIIFLNGRVKAKLTAQLPELDEALAAQLQECKGFRRIVHSIGVTFVADKTQDRVQMLSFSLRCQAALGVEGSCYTASVAGNGRETRIFLGDYIENPNDTILSALYITFPYYMTGKMTVCFYLNDGYVVPELVPDLPVNWESTAYRQMIVRSQLHLGNVYRLKKAIEKARKGEDVTIAYIGGSITQGAGAKPIATNSYAYRAYRAFCARFASGDGSHVHFVKAGVGGTPSELGLVRYNRDVLRNGAVRPDVLIVEFAVNDAGDETNGVCYESLVLKALRARNHPAVILLFAVFMDDWNLQDRLSVVGYQYDLGMISIKDAVVPQFYEDTVITKRQYFYDLYHPSNMGHRVMAECLDYYFELADQADMPESDLELGNSPVIGNRYWQMRSFSRQNVGECHAVTQLDEGAFTDTDTNLQCVEIDANDYATPKFPDNWMHQDGVQAFSMEIACQDLFLVYKDSDEVDFGEAEVWVDGICTRKINPLEVGWIHCNAVIVYKGECVRSHEVQIRMKKGQENKKFTILGFGYI